MDIYEIIINTVQTYIRDTYDMALDAYKIKEVSQFTPWQPILWPFKSVICIGFSLLILQGIAEFLRSVIALIRGEMA